MAQADIIKLLEKHKKLSAEEMEKLLNQNRSSISTNLNALIRHGEITRENGVSKHYDRKRKCSFNHRIYIYRLKNGNNGK